MSDIVSKQCKKDISHLLNFIIYLLQETEKTCKLNVDIRNQGKTKVRQITKEQREELLEQQKIYKIKKIF